MRGIIIVLTAFTVVAMGRKVSAARGTCTSISDNDSFPKWYDTTTHICKNGVVHQKETLTDLILNKVIRGIDNAKPEATQYTKHTDIRQKGAVTSCGLTEYEPKSQTCCVQMRYQYKIHDGPHSTHVCCELEAYPRGYKHLPCNHSSMNDPLFEPRNFKRYSKTNNFCYDKIFRFSLELKQKYMSPTFRHYNATLTPLNLHNAASKHVKVAIDKYSPRKSLDGKTLLIISEHNHSKDQTFDFYLRSSDEVYTGTCNARTLFNRLTKQTRRKCKNGKRRRSLI